MTEKKNLSRAQWSLALLILSLAVGRIAYAILVGSGLKETAALFIGLPALLAIIVTLTPQAKSTPGIIFKGITIALLMSGILLQEGFICILMAAPLFYGVGFVVWHIKRNNDHSRSYNLLLLPLLALSLEGTQAALSFQRHNSVTMTHVVAMSEQDIQAALATAPQFTRPLPSFLQLGFPRPSAAFGSGLTLGDERLIHFANGSKEMGTLTWLITAHSDNHVRFQAAADSTPIAEWLTWQTTDIQWQAIDAHHTRVTWTINYKRQLDPAWYFAPLEQHGVKLAANYLAASYFGSTQP